MEDKKTNTNLYRIRTMKIFIVSSLIIQSYLLSILFSYLSIFRTVDERELQQTAGSIQQVFQIPNNRWTDSTGVQINNKIYYFLGETGKPDSEELYNIIRIGEHLDIRYKKVFEFNGISLPKYRKYIVEASSSEKSYRTIDGFNNNVPNMRKPIYIMFVFLETVWLAASTLYWMYQVFCTNYFKKRRNRKN